MSHYREPRKITFDQVVAGDLVYLPYGDSIIEVHSAHRLVVQVGGVWRRTVVLAGWITPQRGGPDRWTDNCRQIAEHRAYVYGDMRDCKSYEGEDRSMSGKLRKIRINRPLPAGVALGAMVRYHGSITSEHWAPFYIEAIDEQHRLTLRDRDYPSVTVLRGVALANVTPTGETIEVCPSCPHEAGTPRQTWGERHCEVLDCECTDHDEVRQYERSLTTLP